jgi:hypothetical protein
MKGVWMLISDTLIETGDRAAVECLLTLADCDSKKGVNLAERIIRELLKVLINEN